MRTMSRLTLRTLVPAAALALAACSPAPIYKSTQGAITAQPFQVAQSPERYANGQVIWGGRIVGVRNLADRSEVQVLAYPLDSSQRPKLSDTGNGRFIAVVSGYVEPINYPDGSPITVSGTLTGSRAGQVGQANYVFPLVNVRQSHVWTSKEMQQGHNNVNFGVGLGVGL